MQKNKYPFYCNKKEFEKTNHDSGACGSCLKWFAKTAIKEWVDREQTALCPHCQMDKVCFFESQNHEEVLFYLNEVKFSEKEE